MANRKNLANGTLKNPVAKTDTTWTLDDGFGATMPAVPFYLTATPLGLMSTMSNSEIVLVTAISGDTLTVTRAQMDTDKKEFNAGDVVANGVYTQDLDSILQLIYPIGAPYINFVDNTDPAITLGFGTWELLDGVVIGAQSATSGSIMNAAAGTIVGEETHALTADENGTHSHRYGSTGDYIPRVLTGATNLYALNLGDSGSGSYAIGTTAGTFTVDEPQSTVSAGSGTPHNITQKTVIAYIWKRVS